jgi:hypothetical protein
MAKRVLAFQESDPRMQGTLKLSVQRVIPVTQADINTTSLYKKALKRKALSDII